MNLPFTQSEFFGVFSSYNTAVWPLQIAFLGAAVLTVAGISRRRPDFATFALLLLSGLWLWMALVYHAIFFRPINPAAVFFAAIFAAQAVLLAHAARTPGQILIDRGWRGMAGSALVTYALLVYPVIGYFAGHHYPATPTFGVPCPTTLFTVGVLLWLRPIRPALLIVPALWSAIGLTAAFSLGVYQDAGLAAALIAAVIATALHVRAWWRTSHQPVPTHS